MSNYKKIIAQVLLSCFIFSIIPTQVLAKTLNNKAYVEPQFNTEEDSSKSKKEGKIVKELEEKREENTKHFLLEDNTYKAVIYEEPVHYMEDGKWKDIDNTLIDGKDEEGNDVLENTKNDFKVKIAKKSNSKKLIEIKKDKYELSWRISKSKGNVKNKDLKKQKTKKIQSKISKDKTILKNIKSKVKYENIEDGINLEYDVDSKKVKESIVLNQRIDNYKFEFSLKVKNLIAKLNKDKSISFYDESDNSKLVYSLESPFMYDSKGEISKDIEVTLDKKENEYILTILPSKEWLDSNERVYPIVIDPTIQTSQNINSIKDSYVAAGVPNSNYGGIEFLQVGKGRDTGTNRAYISFDLPKIESSNIITKAYLYLWQNQANYTPTQIDVHKVNSAWDSSTITWNNKPEFNSKIEDYAIVSGPGGGDPFKWDITTIAKEWTSTGQNNGLMLKNHNEASGYNQFISSDSESGLIEGRPTAVIYYTDSSGLENYWTYHSQSVGRAGTGYVNDYNGNLVFVHNDLSMNGNRMPISLSHVFNSNEKDDSIGYGRGWRLNLSQRIVLQTINNIEYYIYTDEDGTKHYLKYDSTNKLYTDESGIDITLTMDWASTNERYRIKDKKDNQLIFTESGYLYKIKDNNSNVLTLSYGGATLKTITDGAGRVTKLDTNEYGYLIGITDPSGRRTSFAYTGINLTKITYPDGKYSTYTYDSNNNLTSAVNYDGYKMKYFYYSTEPYRVKDIGEYGKDNTAGMGLHINYGYNTTIFNDHEGKKNIYQFNNAGNTISIRDDYGNALYYDYNVKKSNGEDVPNKLSLESKLQKPINNYLKNHNAEIVSNWIAVNEYQGGDEKGSNIYDTTYKYLGKQSLRIKKVDTLKSRLYKQTLSLEKEKEYTLSSYVKTVGISNANKKGAAIFITYWDVNGEKKYFYSNYINGTNDWERHEVSFTIPEDASTNTCEINVGIEGEAGTAYFDCMQLEEGSAANRYNILENSNFSYGMDFWTKNYVDDSGDTIITSSDSTYPIKLDKDKKVFRINGSADKNKNLYQKINISGNKGDVFVVSGWAKGDSVPLESGRYFALDVGIEKTDGTYEWKVVPFNEDSTEWQYVSAKIKADADYKSMTFYALYYKNENTAYFDGLQLYKEEFGESYQYDDKGNLISTQDLADQKSQFEYSENDDIEKMIDVNGGSFSYDYDTKHNLTKATSAENVIYSFSYDVNGNPETATVGNSTNGLTIKSSAGYTENGNYISYVEDSSGNRVTYDYNREKGTLDRVTDANGNSIFYSYDEMDRLKGAYSIPASEKIEVFPLTGTSISTKGSKPTDDNAIYEKDANGKAVLSAYTGANVLYDLGLNKNAGTVGVWFNTGTENETRYILASEGTGSNIIHMYIGSDNKIHAALRTNSGSWNTIINSSGTVAKNTWYFAALKWEHDGEKLNCTLQLNNTRDTGSTNDFKDFIGAQTSVGSYISGTYTLNGVMDEFIYSSEALSNDKLDSIFSGGRGNYLSQNYTDNGYTYEDDRIKSVTHNGFSYTFNYDNLGNNTTVNVGNQKLITNNYEPRTSRLKDSVYGNGHKVEYKYDEEDRVIADKYNGVEKFKYKYDASGNLGILEDLINGVNYRYIYDASERLTKIKDSKGNIINYRYDKGNNLSTFQEKVDGKGYMTSYDYDKDNRPTNIYYNNPLKNHGNMEHFPLNGTTTGSKGTKPYSETGSSFTKDLTVSAEENGKNVLTTTASTKILYDLGIKKDEGTMGVWFTTKNSGTTRYILASEGKDNAVLSMYLDENNKLNLAIRNSAGGWLTLITSTEAVTVNTWNYTAFTWNVSETTLNAKLYLNDKVYSGNTTNFKDFTGVKTAVGGTVSGAYQLNGQLEGLISYNTALTSEEINRIYANGRGNWVNYKYDSLGRLTNRALNTGIFNYNTKYTFEDGTTTGTTTTRVKEIDNNSKKISYTYDQNGNIKTITEDGKTITYYYDGLNQLIREDNQVLNKTITYSYDGGGNITSKTEYQYTTGDLGAPTSIIAYGYGDSNWKDKLTSFNGKAITYDSIGNPLIYDGYTFTWEQGRQLAGISGNGKNIGFKYNVDGIRTEKTVDGVTTKYHLEGDNVTYETYGTDETEGAYKIYYTYGTGGKLVSMNISTKDAEGKWQSEEYYYIRNAQGDIIGLYDKNGTQVVSYIYDSWGKLISIDDISNKNVGEKNPYRYRGYRYDKETGLYYLNSRYYNAEWGRFVNEDALTGNTGELLSHNVFAYCSNNPIMRQDPSGYFWETILDVASVIVSTIQFIKNPSWANAGWLALDIGATALPFVPGSYATKAVKAVDKVDNIADTSKAIKMDLQMFGKGTSKAYAKEKVTRRTKQITEARRKIIKSNIEVEKVKFLGSDNIKVANGKWRSRDGRRQFRAKLNDINGRHGNIGSHIHFEFLDRTMEVLKNVHVPIR